MTHVMWALHAWGVDVGLKGGSSLSKRLALIEHFSEDLDFKIEPRAPRADAQMPGDTYIFVPTTLSSEHSERTSVDRLPAHVARLPSARDASPWVSRTVTLAHGAALKGGFPASAVAGTDRRSRDARGYHGAHVTVGHMPSNSRRPAPNCTWWQDALLR